MKQMKLAGMIILFLLAFFFLDGILSLQKIPDWQEDPTLQIENQNLKKDLKELQESLDITNITGIQKISSKLIYRDPFQFFSQITILKGEDKNIEKGSAVINEQGLIGIIKNVTNHQSTVELITHQDTSISVRIGNTYGVLVTDDKENNWVTNLTSKEPLEVGMDIYTSGLTNLPGEIKIGSVEEIQPDELGLIQKVKVKRFVDFNQINYVYILQKEKLS